MKIAILLCVLYFTGFQMVAHVFASYTDTITIAGNKIATGTYKFQVSTTDSNGDGIADPQSIHWSSNTSAVWATPNDWVPGQSFANTVFLRSGGNVDIGQINLKFADGGSVGEPIRNYVKLNRAWYDKNGNGVQDPGEDLMSIMQERFDKNGDNTILLSEILSPGSGYIKLESGDSMLPGSLTNNLLGGSNGTGKGLTLEWYLLGSMPVEYGGSETSFIVNLESFHHVD